MPSFLKIFFDACLGCTARTFQQNSQNQISRTSTQTIPSHKTSIPRRFPTSVSSNRPCRILLRSNLRATAKWYDNGVSQSFHTRLVLGEDSTGDQGWVTVEMILIRLNTSFTPSGRFQVYSNESVPDANGRGTRIGYDAAVCVQMYEPWIIETYNTSVGSPSALRIVEKGSGNTSPLPSGNIRGAPIANTRNLNATGKGPAFYVAHDYSINQVVRDGLRDGFYTPSLTVGPVMPSRPTFTITLIYPQAVSFTDGGGPLGYIELSPVRFAVIRARANAATVLPYLVGSGPVVAQSYKDETLAYATYKQWELICLPVLILILGIIGELFVPTLPFDLPRREFGVYSWLALLRSQARGFSRIPCMLLTGHWDSGATI